MTTVMTLMWGSAWERYGNNFASSFVKYWPEDVRLLVVADRELPLERGEILPLEQVKGHADFVSRWRDDRRANGYVSGVKADARGYSWRHDAVKWSGQAMAPELAAAACQDGDLLIWLDADVVTFDPVPADLATRMLGGAELAFLGREPKHSELGGWAIRVNAATRGLVRAMADTYRSDAIFDLKEWHSAFVFDHARRIFERAGGTSRNMTPGGRGHVWFKSPLGRCTDHLKGPRKAMGRSPERKK